MTVAAVEPIAARAAASAGGTAAGSTSAKATTAKPLRTPRAGKSKMAVPFPEDTPKPAEPKPAAEPKAAAEPKPTAEPKAEAPMSDFGAGVSGGSVDVGTMVLLFFGWVWIGLPLLTGGPAKVKALWMAKWLNQAPDGQELP